MSTFSAWDETGAYLCDLSSGPVPVLVDVRSGRVVEGVDTAQGLPERLRALPDGE